MTEPARSWPAQREQPRARAVWSRSLGVAQSHADTSTMSSGSPPRRPIRPAAGGTARCPREAAGTEWRALEARAEPARRPWGVTLNVSGWTGHGPSRSPCAVRAALCFQRGCIGLPAASRGTGSRSLGSAPAVRSGLRAASPGWWLVCT